MAAEDRPGRRGAMRERLQEQRSEGARRPDTSPSSLKAGLGEADASSSDDAGPGGPRMGLGEAIREGKDAADETKGED